VLILRADAADLLTARFALSPLWELGSAVRITHRAEGRSWHEGWLGAIRDRPSPDDVAVLHALQPVRGYTPDFLAPPPTGPGTAFAEELARVAGTPLDQVEGELRRCRADGADASARTVLDGLIADPAAARSRIVAALDQCWGALLAPHWPRLQSLLDRDIAYRARRLADSGLVGLLDDLHPDVRFRDGAVQVDWRRRGNSQERDVSGAGLVLMPSAFVWPRPRAILDRPWQPTVVYPVRGIDELWRSRRVDVPVALAGVLGASRARLLVDLGEPADTSTLALRHDMAASAVSRHLHVLRRAGLLVAHRDRRRVLYRRTALGEALCAAQDPG
jgi:DNA-binding transcriptional ArsR family regulator